MITAKRETKIWTFGCLALLVTVILAMCLIARGARSVSDDLRLDLEPPGPPVSRANLKSVMGDVPVAPFFALNEDATNDRALRLQSKILLGQGQNKWILAFRSDEPYSTTAAWYQRHLEDWAVDDSDNSSGRHDRQRNGIRELGWTRHDDRLMLVYLPARPGEMLLFVSSPPPRRHRPPT